LLQQKERINRQIRVRELQLIGPEGENLGLVPLERAWAIAEEKGLDLVEIGPKAIPPVAKILDYGKFLYEKRKAAKGHAKGHVSEVKAIQITIGTGTHDLERKAREGSEWLREGHRVKVTLFLKGRAKYLGENFHRERIERALHFFSEPYKVVEGPKRGPRGMMMVIERDRQIKTAKDNENEQVIRKENPGNQEGQASRAEARAESLQREGAPRDPA